jgi:LacI family transcriptional regulator
MSSPKPTKHRLIDVAELAGVSIATASRALSKPHLVAAEMREQVARAVKRLNYRPDRVARALSLGHNTTIGAIVPTLGIAVFAAGVECLESRLDELGYTLLLGNSQYDARKELNQIRAFAENNVAGLILVAGDVSKETLACLRSIDVPVVCTYMHKSRYGFPSVGIDNYKATNRLANHLISIGHRKFGIVSNTLKPNARSAARRDGAIDAIVKFASGQCHHVLAEVGETSVLEGRRAFQRILHSDPEITAVICTSDALALGVLAECKDKNLEVPGDVSITGYDDMEFVAHTDPPLTSVRVPAKEISIQAVELLIAMIAGESVRMSTEFEAEIIFRGSIAPPIPAKG